MRYANVTISYICILCTWKIRYVVCLWDNALFFLFFSYPCKLKTVVYIMGKVTWSFYRWMVDILCPCTSWKCKVLAGVSFRPDSRWFECYLPSTSKFWRDRSYSWNEIYGFDHSSWISNSKSRKILKGPWHKYYVINSSFDHWTLSLITARSQSRSNSDAPATLRIAGGWGWCN